MYVSTDIHPRAQHLKSRILLVKGDQNAFKMHCTSWLNSVTWSSVHFSLQMRYFLKGKTWNCTEGLKNSWSIIRRGRILSMGEDISLHGRCLSGIRFPWKAILLYQTMIWEFCSLLLEKLEACTQTRVYFDSVSQSKGTVLRRRKPQKPAEVCRVHATGIFVCNYWFCIT